MRHFVRYDLVPLLSVVAVCVFPCVFMYSTNAAEVPASAMAPFLLIFHVNALVFLGIASIFFRNLSRAALWTDGAMLVVINFGLLSGYVKRALPWLRDRYQLAFFAVLLLGLFVLLLIKKPDVRTGCMLVLIAFGAMIFMNLVQAVPAMIRSHEIREEMALNEYEMAERGGPGGHHGPGGSAEHGGPGGPGKPPRGEAPPMEPPSEPTPEEMAAKPERQIFSGEKPNVYYFIFDEYGGYYNLKHYYDFDNGPFLTALEEKGFSVSYDSRNTEAVATDTIMPNLLNLDYVVKVEESGHKKAVYRNNTQLARMFLNNGYGVNLVNHVDYLGVAGCRVLTDKQTRRTISDYLLRNSVYGKVPFLRELLDDVFLLDYGANYRASLDNAMEAAMNCWQETRGKPTLTISYIQSPHSPTMVGRHGEAMPFATGWNWRDPSLYLNQLQYMNDYTLELVDTLQENDPDAMIIIQSDHGNRYPIHMIQLGDQDSYDPYVENQYMQNTLNCVYYKGRAFDIEGMTGINTLRFMFTEVLGADLPPIEPIQDYSNDYDDEAA